MGVHIAKSQGPRVVIIGGGFGGLEIAKRLRKSKYQVVVLDKNNFHQFQPLFYQVATAGLEPSSIIFPFRKIFQRSKNIHFRMADVREVHTTDKYLDTSIGRVEYDHLIIAAGANNNFFGNKRIEENAMPMKSIQESLDLRNTILERFEEALAVPPEEREAFLTIAIAGAGPTGVELAGTLVEMKGRILPKDYPELDFSQMRIILVEGSSRVLNAMSEKSSETARRYLEKMGVEVRTDTRVDDYNGQQILLNDVSVINSKTLIWAAGIKGNFLKGIPESVLTRGNRIQVDELNKVQGLDEVYAVGDVASMVGDPNYSDGHPQLAQAAIQQGRNLARNFKLRSEGKPEKAFRYKNLGTMATIGRNKAVVELPNYKFAGFFAWVVWMGVHLRSILGVKNKFIVFLNWVWNYFTYNLSLRLILRSTSSKVQKEEPVTHE